MSDDNGKRKSKKEYLADFKRITSVTKTMFRYMVKNAPFYTAAIMISLIFLALFPFVFAFINGKFLDALIKIVTEGDNTKALFTFAGISIALVLVRGVVNALYNYFDLRIGYEVARKMNEDVTRKFAYLDIEYYENPETNVLIQKVSENYGHRPLNFMDNILSIMTPIISIISGVAIMATFSPILIFIVLLSTAPSFANNVIFGRKKWGIWAAKGDVKRDYWMSRHHLTQENSLMELKVFKTRNYLLERVYALFSNFQNEQVKVENRRVKADVALNIVSTFGFGAAYITIALAAVAKRITIGNFNFYLSTVQQLSSGFNNLFGSVAGIYENGLYVADIFDFMQLPPKVTSGKEILSSMELPPKIEIKNLSFIYPGSKEKVIKDLNLTIEPKEHIAIVGENGAGKSTLIKILMRFYELQEGEINIDNIKLSELDTENWYDHVGTLFQDFNRYHFDAKTNIGVGNTKDLNNLEGIIAAAKHAGADEFIQKYENKYDQVLSKSFEKGIRPSVGQWQKIALARAFFKNAPILILDEPTSAIDPKAEAEIFENLFSFAKDKTVIIISHRFSTVRNAKRILVLEGGEIIEQGTHEELITIQNGKYKTAFEIQKRGYE